MKKKTTELLIAAAIMLLGFAVFFGGMIFEPGNTLFWLIAAIFVMGASNWLVKLWQDRKK